MKTTCFIISLVLFILATIVALGSGTVEHAGALLPAGLAFFVAAHVVPDRLG